VLRLRNGSAVALLAWRGEEALLAAGDAERRLPVQTLAAQWTGSYTVLWRLPLRYWDVIRPGSRGPGVERVALHLSYLRGEAVTAAKNAFDEPLVRQLREFQMAEGLAPDGVAGPQTLIRLDKAVARTAPTLSGQAVDN